MELSCSCSAVDRECAANVMISFGLLPPELEIFKRRVILI